MRDDVQHWFDTYQPRGSRRQVWTPEVRSFVQRCLDEVDPSTPRTAQRHVGVLVGLIAWSLRDGLPLDIEVVLSPAVVERYTLDQLNGSGAGTYRSDLRFLGRRLTRRAPWLPPAASVSRRHVAAPYTDSELADLWHAVDRQPSAELRQAGRTLVALGAGAGLDGRWVARVSTEDVHTVDGVLTVEVGAPNPREIPVLREFRMRLEALVAEVTTPMLIGSPGPGKNWLSRTTSRIRIPPQLPPLTPGRLRATWLRLHLERATRLPELARAAGLEGLTVLSDLVPAVAPLPGAAYLREVAGDNDG